MGAAQKTGVWILTGFEVIHISYFINVLKCIKFVSSHTFLQQKHRRSVDARIWEIVPNLWNNIATNWITIIKAKKNTKTRPIGSNWRYFLSIRICFREQYKYVRYYKIEEILSKFEFLSYFMMLSIALIQLGILKMNMYNFIKKYRYYILMYWLKN